MNVSIQWFVSKERHGRLCAEAPARALDGTHHGHSTVIVNLQLWLLTLNLTLNLNLSSMRPAASSLV